MVQLEGGHVQVELLGVVNEGSVINWGVISGECSAGGSPLGEEE